MIQLPAKLRLPIVMLLASLLVGAGVFHLALNKRLASEARLITETLSAKHAAQAVREAPSRLIQDRNQAPLYNRILASGFIGAEDRVGWISALAQSQSKLQLGSLAWRMSPRTTSLIAPELYVSKMEFNVSAVDPDKLSALFAHLRTSASGRFTVERCTLTFDRNSSGNQASCRLNWWTLAQHGS